MRPQQDSKPLGLIVIIAVAGLLALVMFFALRDPPPDADAEDPIGPGEEKHSTAGSAADSASSPDTASPSHGRKGAGHTPAPWTPNPFDDEIAEGADEGRDAAIHAEAGHGEEPPEAVRYPTDKDGINDAIFEKLPEIRECYDSWLAVNPDLAGKLVVTFVISEEEGAGEVTSAEIGDATMEEHGLFEGCVLNVMSELAFEAPPDEGQITVNYPFLFKTE